MNISHDHETDSVSGESTVPEVATEHPEFVTETPGQHLAAEAIYAWARVAHELNEGEVSYDNAIDQESDQVSREERWHQRVEALVGLMKDNPDYWFTTTDIHTKLFSQFGTEGWRIKKVLEQIANHPEHAPHFREDRIESGRVRRFWYAQDVTDFELPPLAFADKEVRFREDHPADEEETDEKSSDGEPSPETTAISGPKKMSWNVVFNKDGTGRIGTSTTSDALALHIVDIVGHTSTGLRADTLKERLQAREFTPSDEELDGALHYIKAWLPREYAQRWRDETFEDRNGDPVRQLRVDRTRRK